MLTSDILSQKFIGNASNITWDILIEYANDPTIIQVIYHRDSDGKEYILNEEPNTYYTIAHDKITTVNGAALSDGSTFVSPLPEDDYLIIMTDAKYNQETHIISNSNYSPQVLEDAYDHSVMLARQNKERSSRSIKLAKTDTGSDLELPPLAEGLGKYLYVNLNGEAAWASGTTSDSTIADEALAQAQFNEGLLNDIASDSEISPVEKPNLIQIVDSINTEKPIIVARAQTYNVSTNAYETAVTDLNNYLATLTTWTLWNNTSGTTTVVRTTFNNYFNTVYSTRQTVLAAISDEAKVLTDNAQAIADGQIVGFYQDAEPTGMSFGDIWIDTDGHIPPTTADIYRYQNTDGSSKDPLVWDNTPDDAIGKVYLDAYNAQTTADYKITTFYENLGSIPTSTAIGDLWVVLDDGNKLYRAAKVGANEIKAGEWESVQDQTIIDNVTAIADRPTYAESDSYYTGSGVTVPTVPTVTVEGWFKSVSLRWDIQENLTWLKHYEVQISSDNSTWYSLEFDGSDFKDVLNGWTVSTENRVVHSNLPLVDGVGSTYYYRVRRVTRAGVKSNWSTSVQATVSGITTTVITDDAITTPKITTGAVKADQIDSLAVTTDKLDSEAVTAAKIKAGTITANEITLVKLSDIDTTGEIAAAQANAEDYSQVADFAKYSGTVTSFTNDYIYTVPFRYNSSGSSEVRKLVDVEITGAYDAFNIGGTLWMGSSSRYQYSCDLQVNLTTTNPSTSLGRMDAQAIGGDASSINSFITITEEQTASGRRLRIYTDIGAYSGILWDAKVQEAMAGTIQIWQTGLDEGDVIDGTVKTIVVNNGVEDNATVGATAAQAADISTALTGSVASTRLTGDINSARITEILPGVISTGLVSASTGVLIGFSGSDSDNPQEGDRGVWIDEDEISFEEYTSGAWSTVNSIKLGGVDSNSLFYPFLQCRGVVNPLANEVNQEYFPSPDFRLFNFNDSTYTDQNGVDDWELKSNVAIDTLISKFGGKGLQCGADGAGLLRAVSNWTVGSSQSAGAWVYFSAIGTTPQHTIFGYFTDDYDAINVRLDNALTFTAELTLGTDSVVLVTSTITAEINKWYYVGFCYHQSTQKADLIINNEITTKQTTGAWGSGTNPKLFAQVHRTSDSTGAYSHMDELLFAPDIDVDPNLFAQHYNHNIPWNTDASAKDIILKPTENGNVVVDGSMKVTGSIGYSGTGTLERPHEGDRRIYIDGDEIRFAEYTGGTWSTVNQIRFGGKDSNDLFYPFLKSRGVVNPLAAEVSPEFFPEPEFRVFNFENNYEDQNGVDNWGTKSNTGFSSVIKKLGSYSLTGTTGVGGLYDNTEWTLGDSQTMAGWVYFSANVDTELFKYYNDINNSIILQRDNGTLKLRFLVGGVQFLIDSGITPTINTWYYISGIYDAPANTGILTVNNQKFTGLVIGTWGSPSAPYTKIQTYDQNVYYDEILYKYDSYVDPDIFIQHYNHNVPWNTDASAKDIILKPATGGGVFLADNDKGYVSVNENNVIMFGKDFGWIPSNEPYQFSTPVSLNYTTDVHYGFVSFRRNDGTRGAYIGYGNGGNYLDMHLDNADYWVISGGSLAIGSISTYFTQNTDTSLRLTNQYGYLDLGAKNASFSHIYTNLTKIIFNNPVWFMGGLFPYGTAGTLDIGDSINYWRYINYKALYDRGCLGYFDDGVELQDGRVVSDIESLQAIQKHPTKKTIYGVDKLDYRTFPKVCYDPPKVAEKDIYEEDVDGKKQLIAKKGEEYGEEGIEMTSMFSIFIGAFKELDNRMKIMEEHFGITTEKKSV